VNSWRHYLPGRTFAARVREVAHPQRASATGQKAPLLRGPRTFWNCCVGPLDAVGGVGNGPGTWRWWGAARVTGGGRRL